MLQFIKRAIPNTALPSLLEGLRPTFGSDPRGESHTGGRGLTVDDDVSSGFTVAEHRLRCMEVGRNSLGFLLLGWGRGREDGGQRGGSWLGAGAHAGG